jgi:hypothetical protein
MSINFYYQNVRGLKTKLRECYLNSLQQNNTIVLLTETWLNSSIFNNELFNPEYTIYRKDRDLILTGKKDGGGILIAVSNKFPSERLFHLENNDEFMFVRIKYNSNSKDDIVICLTYFPPLTKVNTYKCFFEIIDNNSLSLNNKLIIVGDFNLNKIDWDYHCPITSPINWTGDEAEYVIPPT